MIAFPEALASLLREVPRQAAERCRLEQADGRILRAEVAADRDHPPYDRVMMDGYAIRSREWESGRRRFRVAGTAAAGAERASVPEEAGTCLEVMTGAPCPRGADAIIELEEVLSREEDEVVFADPPNVGSGRFLHRAGSDVAAGEVVLREGVRLGSREIGVAASCGAAWLEVSAWPEIAVVATGDELVPVDAQPLPHQIRQSNAHALSAALKRAGYPVRSLAVLPDDPAIARPRLADLLERHGWLILTGAVSKGGRDFVPGLLTALGGRCVFHGVAQRPGKPAGCWIGAQGQMILALPGNPVSALIGLHAFALPALARGMAEVPPSPRLATVESAALGLAGFTRHLPVRLLAEGRAAPAPPGNSGDFIGLLPSDGFVTIPPRHDGSHGPAVVPFTAWL